jgi:hypothetical protein
MLAPNIWNLTFTLYGKEFWPRLLLFNMSQAMIKSLMLLPNLFPPPDFFFSGTNSKCSLFAHLEFAGE